MAAPWAKLELRGSSPTVSIIPLSSNLEPVTTPGVVPLDTATQAVLAKGVTSQPTACNSRPCPSQIILNHRYASLLPDLAEI
ncbi:MAG: hypothetical protein U0401_19630 [Anaerolineae bacterium]